MDEASVVLDMPLDRAAVSCLGVSLNSSDLALYFVGSSMKSPLSLVMHAEAPSSSISIPESESNCRPGGVSDVPFAQVVVTTGMDVWDNRSCGTFLYLRRRGPALRMPCVRRLQRTLKFVSMLNKGSELPRMNLIIDLINSD